MENTLFPTCLAWNLSCALSGRDCNYLAYISRRELVILNYSENGTSARKISPAHTNRLRAVASNPKGLSEAVITSAEDGIVKYWDLNTFTVKKGHCGHENKDVIGLSWSHADPNIVVSCDSSGSVVEWHVIDNTLRQFSLPRNYKPNTLACCPLDKSLVAVGSVSGLIIILKLKEGGIVQSKLRGHEGDIHSLVWQPVFNGATNCLLASTSKHRTLTVMDAYKTGKVLLSTPLPTQCFSKIENDEACSQGKDNSFFPLDWYDSDTIVTVGVKGELVSLNISEIASSNSSKMQSWRSMHSKWHLVHRHHRRSILAILVSKDLIWTVGIDRVFNCSKITGEQVYNLSSISGTPICVAPSPYEASLLAFGCEDGVIRLWDATQPTGSSQLFSQNIHDTVTSVTWHPLKECTLTYGTSVGRVGIIDITKPKKNPSLLHTQTHTPVYWLVWGPNFFNTPLDDTHMDLYTLSNKTVFLYTFSKEKDNNEGSTSFFGNKAENFSAKLQLPCTKHTDIAWKPDWSLLAIGAENGTISLLIPPSLTAAFIIPAYSAFVQYLTWHPHMTSNDTEKSPHHGLITSGSRDSSNDVNVFRVTMEQDEETEKRFIVRAEKIAKLSGHLGYVQSVAWSPHESGHLISTSSDASVQIWNVLTGTRLASFVPYPGKINWFAIWSPLNPDFVISGSYEIMINIWQISTSKKEFPTEKPKAKKKKARPESLVLLNKTEKSGSQKGQPEIKTLETGIHLAKKISKAHLKEATSEKTIWMMSSDEQWSKFCDFLKNDNYDASLFSHKFLAEEDVFNETLKKQEEIDRGKKNTLRILSTSLTQGRLKEVIEGHIKDGTITEEMVAMAPSVSPRLWQDACLAMGHKYRSSQSYVKAANYYFMCHQLNTAIEVLVEGNLFLEALTLARSQFTLDDPIIKEIVLKYGHFLCNKHNDYAAECLLFAGDLERFIEIASKIKKPGAWECAALASRKLHADNELKTRYYALQALRAYLREGSGIKAQSILLDYQQFGAFNILYSMWKYIQIDELTDILVKLPEEIQLPEEPKEYYSHLYYPYDNNVVMKDIDMVWAVVADELSLAICSSEETLRQQQHMLQALDAMSKNSISAKCMFHVCQRLAPSEGFKHPSSLFCGASGRSRSLRAFLCYAMLQLDSPDLLPEIAQLEIDLLDEENFIYTRNSLVIKKCDLALTSGSPEQLDHLVEQFSDKNSETKMSTDKVGDVLRKKAQLVEQMRLFEEARGLIPNPATGFQMLRNLCLHDENDIFSRELLKYIDERCLPFMH